MLRRLRVLSYQNQHNSRRTHVRTKALRRDSPTVSTGVDKVRDHHFAPEHVRTDRPLQLVRERERRGCAEVVSSTGTLCLIRRDRPGDGQRQQQHAEREGEPPSKGVTPTPYIYR